MCEDLCGESSFVSLGTVQDPDDLNLVLPLPPEVPTRMLWPLGDTPQASTCSAMNKSTLQQGQVSRNRDG